MSRQERSFQEQSVGACKGTVEAQQPGRRFCLQEPRASRPALALAPWSVRWTISEQARRKPFGGLEGALDPGATA